MRISDFPHGCLTIEEAAALLLTSIALEEISML